MEREQFISELIEKLNSRTDLEIAENGIRYYEDGFTSSDEKDLLFIRETNIKYHKTEADKLIGDFVVILVDESSSQQCRFECDYLFEEFNRAGWDFIWEIIDENIALAKKMKDIGLVKLMQDNDYKVIKDKLFIRPLNFTDHKYEFKDVIYRKIGDVALVLYILAEDVHTDKYHNVSSVKVHRMQMEEWGVPEDEIWEIAMSNTYLMAPPRLFTNVMESIDAPYHKGAFMALGSNMKIIPAGSFPAMLTTTGRMNGAIAFFYPGVKERIAQMYGSDYYVAFTGIHEICLHKKGTISPRDILRNLKATNKNGDPEETLSRKVYLYEKDTGVFKQLEL